MSRQVAMLVASLLLLAACGAPARAGANPTATIPAKWKGVNMDGMPTVTPPASVSPRPLPAFSDPRVAYIGPDSLLHVVSLDGKIDLAGTPIPLAGFAGEGIWAAGTSPDGQHLAYFEHEQLTTIAAASGARNAIATPGVDESAPMWAPDQRYLALRYFGAVECVSVANGSTIVAPKDTIATNSRPLVEGPYGWIDATHVVVSDIPDTSGTPGTHGLATPAPSATTQITLESLNVTTKQLRPIITLRGYGNGGFFRVLPGGRWTLFVDIQNTQQPFTPFVPLAALIDNTTGSMTRLPHLSSLLPNGLFSLLWRPGSTQAIVSGDFGPGTPAYLLIDVRRDTAAPLVLAGSPVAWSPDGSTLITATSAQAVTEDSAGFNDVGEVGSGPFTLLAERIGMTGGVSSPVTLTTRAMSIPMLGFVHTG